MGKMTKALTLAIVLVLAASQSVYAGTLTMSAKGASQNTAKNKALIDIQISTVSAGLENDQYISNSATATIQIMDRATHQRLKFKANGMVQAVPQDASGKNGSGNFTGIADPDGITDSGDELSVYLSMHQNWYLTGNKTYSILIEKSYPLSPTYEKIYEASNKELKNGAISIRYSESAKRVRK